MFPILGVLNNSLQCISLSFVTTDPGELQEDVEHTWQLPCHSLTLTVLSKLLTVFPNQSDEIAWTHVTKFLLFPHAWVRTAACRPLGLFSSMPVASPRADLPAESPLSSLGMQEIAKVLTQQLKGEHLDENLSLQVIKNLFFIGKCFCLMPIERPTGDSEKVSEDDDRYAKSPLPWLFSTLSYKIRSAHIARASRAAAQVRVLPFVVGSF